jgi:two-component system sensor histidine kinase KdpD
LELQQATERDRSREAEFQAEKIKSAFLDAVTHDLRTPLTSIKAAASSLQHERLESPDRVALGRIREFLEVIIEESDRLNRFIENIIALAKRRHGGELQTQETSVSELVEAAVERAAGRLRDRRLELDIPANMPKIAADREAIVEVLYTLLDNAAKYSSTYSRIDLRVRRVEDAIHITVEDEGIGIAQELRSRVFERFARASDQTHGFGMGLSIAKTIVDAHQGRIWIEGRRTGHGVAVTFSLPLQPATIHAGAAK